MEPVLSDRHFETADKILMLLHEHTGYTCRSPGVARTLRRTVARAVRDAETKPVIRRIERKPFVLEE